MRECVKKINQFLLCALFTAPCGAWAAGGSTGFNMAAQLLSAARNGNTRLVQNLINSGADVNYVDSTGVSVVCTAVMNNDMRAVQILQMYGADASNCDRQIKNYKNRTSPAPDSGLFAGLSSTHKLVLGTVGVAAVVGGLLWATDAFDDGDSNTYNGGTGSHAGGGSSESGGGSLAPAFTVPYGTAMVDSNGNVVADFNIDTEADVYSSGDFANNFSVMNSYGNYLLMMHGYYPFARGYMGQSTLRYGSAHSPVPSVKYSFSVPNDPNLTVSGGIPVNVALVTANGINAAANTSLQDRVFAWTTMGADTIDGANPAATSQISGKYFNSVVSYNTTAGKYESTEDTSMVGQFDLSGNNHAISNSSATDMDNLLAKIVGGYVVGDRDGRTVQGDGEDPLGDSTGFMPNGQMTIYRTGGGANNTIYRNYEALVSAASYATGTGITVGTGTGRAKVSVIANLDIISPLRDETAGLSTFGIAKTIQDFVSLSSGNYTEHSDDFYDWIALYYNNNQTSSEPETNARSFFNGLGGNYSPLTVFSVGDVQTDNEYSGAYKYATFENAAPLVFNAAEHLFMSVVAVNLPNGSTASATNVSGFIPGDRYTLSQWHDEDNGNYYKSRICGIAGTGAGSIDPWCFAAAGLTSEQATAAAAGAAGAVKAAFSYMTNKNIFTLLALTADGAYLGTNPTNGEAWGTTTETATNALVSYLNSMYALPPEYQTRVNNNSMTYLDAFKEVYGYGLINLERATTPGKSVYYYSDGKIVSGNAYWRAASMLKHSSSVFGMRTATLPLSFYDVLTDIDNTVSVPRVWNMELSLGNDVSHGLYMGDTLAELKTHDQDNTVSIGNLTFGFARSERAYDDNMSGVDDMSLAYDNNRFGFRADYQHYLTDGAGRFSGLANPVLALASNAMTSNLVLHNGRLSISGRGFVGTVTSEGLLENDPAVSAVFVAAKLGDVIGADTGIKFSGERLSIASNVGTMRESNTVLGAMWDGLLNSNGADTNYIDSVLSYKVSDDIGLTLRGTYAWTRANDIANGVINGLSELKSNSFAAAVRVGNFDLAVSMPLALTRGEMYYSYANFGVNENNELLINNAGEYAIDLTPDVREYRFNASYKHKFGDWTDGALGFIYRVNPNNTDAFGNESIFMMKLSHRLGI